MAAALSERESMTLGLEMEFCTKAVILAVGEAAKLMDHPSPAVGNWASVLYACKGQAHQFGLKRIKEQAPQLSEEKQAVLAWGPAYELTRNILREGQHAPGLFKGRALRAEAQRVIQMIDVLRVQTQAAMELLAPELLAENRTKR